MKAKTAIAVILVFMLTLTTISGCGESGAGGSEGTQAGSGTQGGNMAGGGAGAGGAGSAITGGVIFVPDIAEELVDINDVDVRTAEGFLSLYGLDEAEVEPLGDFVIDWVRVTDYERASNSLRYGRVHWGTRTMVVDEEDDDQWFIDQFNGWVDKVLATTMKNSDDGKVYILDLYETGRITQDEEFVFEHVTETGVLHEVNWSFIFHGHPVRVRCSSRGRGPDGTINLTIYLILSTE